MERLVGAGALGVKTASDVYVGMLKSRTIADQLIARFDLNTVYEQKWQSYTRKTLQSRTDILATKDGIITVSVDDEDPKRAAAITNAYVDELLELTKVLAVTEASQRRLFFEQQLEQTKEKLKAAEIAAREGLEKGGLAKVDDQGRATSAGRNLLHVVTLNLRFARVAGRFREWVLCII